MRPYITDEQSVFIPDAPRPNGRFKDYTGWTSERFFTKETLVGSDIARCPNCGQTSASEKRLSLLSEPTALFLHLKRFRQNGAPRLNQLSFFLKGLRLGSEHDQASGVYDCVAISQYFPGGVGHYTAIAKRNEAWFNFDDSSTELLSPIEASKISLNSSTAYLLFFVRRSLGW